MRGLIAVGYVLLLCACQPPPLPGDQVDRASFVGNWYGIRPNGVTTFHSDSTFEPDGQIEVNFYTCLSNEYESQWTERGRWVWENSRLTITLASAGDSEGNDVSVTDYVLIDQNYDRRVYRNESADYTFWLHRRWSAEPYSCATTRAQVDADRDAAIDDGRFASHYPDYMENDS